MRVPVVLHERLGGWYRQLRPRLAGTSVRWLESRSPADLEEILEGLAFPIVLIDLARQHKDGLTTLELVRDRAPGARTLILDPHVDVEIPGLARELGATHVFTGFAPPPSVADLIARWIDLARHQVESAGWSRNTFPETSADPWEWLSSYVGEPDATNDANRTRWRSAPGAA